MPNPNLNDLLKRWAESEAAADAATDCPRVSVLYYHETESEDLGQYTDHVATCKRCQKRLTLIRTELTRARGVQPAVLRLSSAMRWGGGALALAASVALVFVLWPSANGGPFDAQVAAFANYAYRSGLQTRGAGTASNQPLAEAPEEWITEMLGTKQAHDALGDRFIIDGLILGELRSGGLVLDADGLPVVALNVDDATARTEGLTDLIEEDRDATERIVEIFHQSCRQASHCRSQAIGHHSTLAEHMPASHRKYSEWSPERFLSWAKKFGPHTVQFIEAVLHTRKHPQQSYRTCLGILGLGKRYTDERLEAACQRAMVAGIRTYKGVRNILDAKLDQVALEEPAAVTLSDHANVRGETYYH